MSVSPKMQYKDLPQTLPIFPLGGVLLLPRGQLPLNIFEPRYLAMIDEAMSTHRLIGMIQTQENGAVYAVGCAGRIVAYQETTDGRYEIVLQGVSRFRIAEELDQKNGFRRVRADWSDFAHDMEPLTCLDMDRDKLKSLLKSYFEKQGLTCSWEAVDLAADEKLITSLAMICPFESSAKQALLEAPCCKERAKLFMAMLEMECSGDCGRKH